MANVAVSGAYVTDVIATQRAFYNQSVGLAYQLLLAISTQLIGFSWGGILRRFLVYPSSMIWPGALVNSALFNTLHRTYGKPDRHISRHKFFVIVVACSFAWYFVPGFLWTGLSVFNWACWIAPNNVVVNTLFGTSTGLGMGIFTFDWSMVSYASNPLVLPVRSYPWMSYSYRLNIFSSGGQKQIQVLASSFVSGSSHLSFTVRPWFALPGSNSQYNFSLPDTNSFFMSYLPMSSSVAFDNTGMPYDPSQIVTNGTFDITKYEAYSPAFLSATLALAYGIAFASFASLVVHTACKYLFISMVRLSSDHHS